MVEGNLLLLHLKSTKQDSNRAETTDEKVSDVVKAYNHVGERFKTLKQFITK